MSDIVENSPQDIVNRYKEPMDQLVKYVPWLEENAQSSVEQDYNGRDMEHTIHFPVYDSNLLSFIKCAQQTDILDRNYIYVYRRRGISSYKDELEFIDSADIMKMDDLAGILSKYILEGNVKGMVWAQGVSNGVFAKVVKKMHELVHFWDHEDIQR